MTNPILTNPTNNNVKISSVFKAVLGGSVGSTLEWFDYGLYAYFASIISVNFFPSKDALTSLMLAFIVYGVGFVLRPLGGIFFGRYGDKVGRIKVLAVTVTLMGVATTCIGILPTFNQIGVAAPVLLVICRLLQGFACGGEWGTCNSYLAEYANPKNRGFIVSWSQFSQTLGLLGGSLTGVFLSAILSKEAMTSWGWRIPFILGILIAGFGFFIRRKMEETPVYQQAEANNALCESPLTEIAKHYKREIIITIGLILGSAVVYHVVMSFMPAFITQILKFPLGTGFQINSIMLIVFMICAPFVGILTDKFGRKLIMLIGSGGMLLFAYPVFYLMSITKSIGVMISMVIVLALFNALMIVSITIAVTEVFPTKVRCTGMGTFYNLTIGCFGGTAPFIVTWLIKFTGKPIAVVYYLIPGMLITFLIMAFLTRETRGEVL